MKRRIIIKLSLLLCSMLLLTNATAQKKSKRKSTEQKTEQGDITVISGTFRGEPVYCITEEPCEFPGGIGALIKYLSKNIRYPEITCWECPRGRVIVTCIIAKDGSVQQVKVVRSLDPYYCDKEALRVVRGMPKWKAGKIKGKPVHQRFTLPVEFRVL